MKSSQLIERLLKRPDLPLIVAEMQLRLREESTRRQEFRQWLDEDKKPSSLMGK